MLYVKQDKGNEKQLFSLNFKMNVVWDSMWNGCIVAALKNFNVHIVFPLS